MHKQCVIMDRAHRVHHFGECQDCPPQEISNMKQSNHYFKEYKLQKKIMTTVTGPMMLMMMTMTILGYNN